ncbi:putative aBC transporter ATP-binding protein [Rickettsia argasii T170-B]|uniref:Putative aBC transporter ATP-binding protein n=2 Tax=Rickettsia argasii TaxID=1441385 RepID=A0A0F3RHQ0_9RICK|nr:putative aBC transporter ATP-binding protein [Rickettsia argasii T170-B]
MNKISADQGSYEWGYESQIAYFAKTIMSYLMKILVLLIGLKGNLKKKWKIQLAIRSDKYYFVVMK